MIYIGIKHAAFNTNITHQPSRTHSFSHDYCHPRLITPYNPPQFDANITHIYHGRPLQHRWRFLHIFTPHIYSTYLLHIFTMADLSNTVGASSTYLLHICTPHIYSTYLLHIFTPHIYHGRPLQHRWRFFPPRSRPNLTLHHPVRRTRPRPCLRLLLHCPAAMACPEASAHELFPARVHAHPAGGPLGLDLHHT